MGVTEIRMLRVVALSLLLVLCVEANPVPLALRRTARTSCSANTRNTDCGPFSYCCISELSSQKTDCIHGDCEGMCSDIPCAETRNSSTPTPLTLCAGDGTNFTAWHGRLDYSVVCKDCPYECWGNTGECYNEGTCAAIVAIASSIILYLFLVMGAVAFLFCVLPIVACACCGLTICGISLFGAAAAGAASRPPQSTVHYVAAPAGYAPSSQPNGQYQQYPQHQGPPPPPPPPPASQYGQQYSQQPPQYAPPPPQYAPLK